MLVQSMYNSLFHQTFIILF